MKTKISAEQFWQFSLSIYADEQVQKSLLHWQNEHGLNINLCLLLAYLDCHQLAISAAALTELEACILDFDSQALKPLRGIRGYLKKHQTEITQYPQLRKQMLELELAFEKQQQQQLIATCQTLALVQDIRPNNLQLYVRASELPLKADLDQALHAIQY
ncbi:TIGR02444 family protein [Pseudoalteromonas pernae]|uniref:TIGR02444 family protein n=1 Tax=Pseudoalteromonas pernae TaxID=3118054 RepID=UPI003242B645